MLSDVNSWETLIQDMSKVNIELSKQLSSFWCWLMKGSFGLVSDVIHTCQSDMVHKGLGSLNLILESLPHRRTHSGSKNFHTVRNVAKVKLVWRLYVLRIIISIHYYWTTMIVVMSCVNMSCWYSVSTYHENRYNSELNVWLVESSYC